MQAITDDVQLNRSLTQPQTDDVQLHINNIDSTKVPYLVGKGVLAIPVSKYKCNGRTLSRCSPKLLSRRPPSVEPGSLSPFKSMFYEGRRRQETGDQGYRFPHRLRSTIYNADTLRHPARHLVGGRDKVTTWKDLDPKFKGKTALVDYAPVGVIDVAMALRGAQRDFKYGDKGATATKDEIDKTIKIMINLRRGHFHSFLEHLRPVSEPDGVGRVVIQSMWSPAVTAAVRSRGIDCYYVPLKEGYRGWFVGVAPMAILAG